MTISPHGFKVGPEYQGSEAHVAKQWIDSDDLRIRSDQVDLSHWWGVFQDPALDHLIDCAYHQNLTLRQAAFRILQARAQLGIAVGNFFPQQQSATGSYQRLAISGVSATTISDAQAAQIASHLVNATPQEVKALITPIPFGENWTFGFNLAWEMDFWGRLRRAIVASQDTLDASCPVTTRCWSPCWATLRTTMCSSALSKSRSSTTARMPNCKRMC